MHPCCKFIHKFAVIQPIQMFVWILIFYLNKIIKPIQCRNHHTRIIRPCSRRLIVHSISSHICNRINSSCSSIRELDRNSQRITNNKSYHRRDTSIRQKIIVPFHFQINQITISYFRILLKSRHYIINHFRPISSRQQHICIRICISNIRHQIIKPLPPFFIVFIKYIHRNSFRNVSNKSFIACLNQF